MSESLQASAKYRQWVEALKTHDLDVRDVQEIYTRHNHKGDVLFSLLLLDALTPEGDPIPPICFLKGLVVCVLVCLIDEATGERYNLLVKQRRICNGDLIYEQVAGMVDGDDDPHAVAVREVAEETGLEVMPEQVILLNEEVLFPSTGTSDEAMHFYYCELTMSREEIFSYDANETGVEDEHEKIYTHVATFGEAKRLIKNVNGVMNIYLYEDAIGQKLN
ncbi:MAG: NUDIX domain-containing protein [Bacteroidota bacterium]